MDWLSETLKIRPEERRPFWYGALSFFLIFVAWYMVRPVREAMGIVRGADDLPWLMIGTVVASFLVNPLFSRIASTSTRTQLVRFVYRFLALNLVGFYLVLAVFDQQLGITDEVRTNIGFGLFIWVSVFSVINNSVLWSLSSEQFKPESAGRLFGLFAAACSLGGIVGSGITYFMSESDETKLLGRLRTTLLGDEPNVLIVLVFAAVLMWIASWTANGIVQRGADAASDSTQDAKGERLKGSAWEGVRLTAQSPFLLGICGYVLGYTIIGTFVYLMQGAIIDAMGGNVEEDTQRFAFLDSMTNSATLFVQVFGMRALVRHFGVTACLGILPLFCMAGLAALWAWPMYAILAWFQVLRRVINYGLAKPAREMLFSAVSTSEKYKAKNLIDLFIYRGGDTIGSVFYGQMKAVGVGISGIAAMAVPMSFVWLTLAPYLGREFNRRSTEQEAESAK